MPKFVELMIAGVIGAVVPIIVGVLSLGGLFADVNNLKTDMQDVKANTKKFLDSHEQRMRDIENFVSPNVRKTYDGLVSNALTATAHAEVSAQMAQEKIENITTLYEELEYQLDILKGDEATLVIKEIAELYKDQSVKSYLDEISEKVRDAEKFLKQGIDFVGPLTIMKGDASYHCLYPPEEQRHRAGIMILHAQVEGDSGFQIGYVINWRMDATRNEVMPISDPDHITRRDYFFRLEFQGTNDKEHRRCFAIKKIEYEPKEKPVGLNIRGMFLTAGS